MKEEEFIDFKHIIKHQQSQYMNRIWILMQPKKLLKTARATTTKPSLLNLGEMWALTGYL